MSLAPAFVADVLQRQGLITPDQAEEVKREARQMGDRVRSAMTYSCSLGAMSTSAIRWETSRRGIERPAFRLDT